MTCSIGLAVWGWLLRSNREWKYDFLLGVVVSEVVPALNGSLGLRPFPGACQAISLW